MSKKMSYSNDFKFKVAMAAIKGDKTATELAVEYNVAISLISKWKQHLLESGHHSFSKEKANVSNELKEQQLYQQIGKLSMEVDFLKKCASKYQLI